MKIAIPITLLEPVGIPWELIALDEGMVVNRIWDALRKYLDSVKDGGKIRDRKKYPDITKMIETSLRVLTIRAGGLDVESGHSRISSNGEYIYYVFYNTRKGGPRFVSKLYE